MKAVLEKIQPGFGSSFTIRKYTDVQYCAKPHWHFHPEYEIVYISNGRGKRHIGDHISYYEDGDLIFLGPDLPHFGFTEELYEEHLQIVVQMKEDFLGKDFLDRPEMHDIRQLFERSKLGLSFSGETKHQVGRRLGQMLNMNNFERLITLLEVMESLADSPEYEILNANGFALEVNAQDHDRMERIYELVEERFQDQITLDEVSGLVNMTTPAFCRYFKKLTRKTFTNFVNEFRVAHACSLLGKEQLTISTISYESGFNNLSHFNKQFKQIVGTTPREYRKNLNKLVQ